MQMKQNYLNYLVITRWGRAAIRTQRMWGRTALRKPTSLENNTNHSTTRGHKDWLWTLTTSRGLSSDLPVKHFTNFQTSAFHSFSRSNPFPHCIFSLITSVSLWCLMLSSHLWMPSVALCFRFCSLHINFVYIYWNILIMITGNPKEFTHNIKHNLLVV